MFKFCKTQLWECSRTLSDVAMGRKSAETVIRNARLVNVCTHEILDNIDVAISCGRIALVGDAAHCIGESTKVIDAEGQLIAPGFLDGHIHIESSMMTPIEYAKAVIPHGTVGIYYDPHEVCNVLGLKGVDLMAEEAEKTPLKAMLTTPSCVPAVPGFEDSGAEITAADIASEMKHDYTVGLGEMMNFPGVVSGDYDVLAKIQLGTSHGKIVDGHAPGLLGRDLDAYLVTGITNTHECTTLEEMRENLRRGSYILIREGSAAKNLRTLLPGVTPGNARRCAFCCDDRHIEDIVSDGHMDNHLRLAVGMGMDPVQAITMCTLNAAECFGLRNKGAIAPGRDADFILVDDLKAFRVRKVFTAGRLIAEDGRVLIPLDDAAAGAPSHSIHLKPLAEDALSLPVRTGKARVIGRLPRYEEPRPRGEDR